jgi:hypothetical protein
VKRVERSRQLCEARKVDGLWQHLGDASSMTFLSYSCCFLHCRQLSFFLAGAKILVALALAVVQVTRACQCLLSEHFCGERAENTCMRVCSPPPLQEPVGSAAVGVPNGSLALQLDNIKRDEVIAKDTPLERQVSPNKLLRAALLRGRFADTILKAQEKTLPVDKVGLLKCNNVTM